VTVPDNKALYIAIAVSLAGGGTIGAGGTSYLSGNTKALEGRMAKVEAQVSKQWEKKADKEYVNLTIKALCK